MVIDTSALLAILRNEADAETLRQLVAGDPRRLISAATLFEAAIVIESRVGEAGGRDLDLLVAKAAAEIVPVDVEQVGVARAAYRAFGKGRHKAGLNYGDCFAYALAIVTGEPLLFKGQDFSHTDVPRVIGDAAGS